VAITCEQKIHHRQSSYGDHKRFNQLQTSRSLKRELQTFQVFNLHINYSPLDRLETHTSQSYLTTKQFWILVGEGRQCLHTSNIVKPCKPFKSWNDKCCERHSRVSFIIAAKLTL